MSTQTEAPAPSPSNTPAASSRHNPQGKGFGLALAALGVVFGDIGTSPLYSLQTVFSIEHNTVDPSPGDVYGVISMAVWAIVLIVTVKYLALVMRADNEGEGGILALVWLLRDKLGDTKKLAGIALMMGIVGASLFLGDSMITPAISVMSAVEGITVGHPGLEGIVMPVSIAILVVLFVAQRWGTGRVGRAFGPVMALWFLTLFALGLPQVIAHPQILGALSPHHAWVFMISRPWVAFIAMGAVVLTITGAEALYADMGHFGRTPIRRAWFAMVLPALLVNYLGQGAMLLDDPRKIDSPFFHLAPAWAQVPIVVLATVATVIASQAVISGAFSVAQQAQRLSLLPRLTIKHTSREEGGQIYVPAVNWILFAGVLTLILVFGTSAHLASAYGLSVTGTLILEMLLFLFLAHHVWEWAWWKIALVGVFIGGMEAVFFAANLMKLFSGGWVPLVIAGVAITIMLTWRRGAAIATQRREAVEGPLPGFLEKVRRGGVDRIPGVAVVPHPNSTTTPLALKTSVEVFGTLPETVVLVSIVQEPVPHIRHVDRVEVSDLGDPRDGVWQVSYHVGFNDSPHIPAAVEWATRQFPELDFDPLQVHFLLSVADLRPDPDSPMPLWQERIFLTLSANSARRTQVFSLPPDRTIVMGSQVRV
ncbi:potassium transporter Kup [Mariniluteicoccus endophyticus]